MNTPSCEKKADLNNSLVLWVITALAPLTMITVSFIVDQWNWGLMDDTSLLRISGPWWKNATEYFHSLMTAGTLRWTGGAFFCAFYPLFHNAPKVFYLFKMLIVVATLLLWGVNAWLLTRKTLALFLVSSITLSFYYFYDAFGYLSVHEPFGMLFGGLAFFFFIIGGILPVEEKKPSHPLCMLAGTAALILCALSKEAFVSTALVLSGTLIAIALVYKNRILTFWGVILFLAGLAHALYLKFWFQHGYSARYDLSDWPTMLFNAQIWLKHSLPFHLPWLGLLAGLLFLESRKRPLVPPKGRKLIILITGVSLYGLFLLLLIPWQITDFYAIPLGLFFGFLMTVALADLLEGLDSWLSRLIIIFVLVFDISVCYCSFGKMTAYRNDTAQLVDWMQYNQEFEIAVHNGFEVATNAEEAGVRIPDLLEMKSGIRIPSFKTSWKVKEIVSSPRALYYLYNPLLGDQNLRLISRYYSVVFSSRSWTLFERNIPRFRENQ